MTAPRHVVVIGASLAGLFTAAAAAGDGRVVTVLERDALPGRPEARPGVPQGRQPHVLLYRGLLDLEELLPGLRRDLIDAGAVPLDTGDLAWLAEEGWMPLGRPGFEVVSASRPLVEHVVRRRVAALPGVQIRPGARANALRRAAPGWQASTADGATVAADLVVDASGRGSRLPGWLAEAGVAPARVAQIDARVGYATRFYAADLPADLGCPGVVLEATTATLTGAMALPAEGGRCMVCVVGMGDFRPPRDAAGFEAFLAGLRDPVLADLVRRAEPAGDVAVHRQTGNLRHRYEDVPDWPDGLLVVGDALCAFDPVYGQGITVAAREALLLRRALTTAVRPGYERRLLRQFASVVSLPWSVATSQDLRYPTSSGRQSPGQALLGRWARELGRLAVHGDVRAQDVLARVYHLVGPPALLFHPAFLVAELRARLVGYGPSAPRPAGFAALAAAVRAAPG